MANPWFRLYSEFADDPKVQMMSEAMQRRLIMLMCSKCKGETLQETLLAFHWRVPPDELLETKELFISNGFIDKSWHLLNWNKRQFVSDSSTERVRLHREMKRVKQNETKNSVSPLFHEQPAALHKQRPETACNVTVTPPDTDTDTEQNIKATPPTVDIPSWIPAESWEAFTETRKKLRAPFTARAQKLTIKSLEKLRTRGYDPGAVLDQSVERGYRGVFEISSNGNGHAPKRKLKAVSE